MKRSPLRSLRLLAMAFIAVGLTTTGAAQSPVAVYTALAVSPGDNPGSSATPIELTITRWSTPAERERINVTLLELGPEKLLDLLRDMPSVGRLSTPGAVGHALRYAVQSKSGGMEHILLLTDRPVGVWEASASGRTLEYPFTVIELRVRPSGDGDGKVAVAAKISVDRLTKNISFEDYSLAPVLLQGLKRDRR